MAEAANKTRYRETETITRLLARREFRVGSRAQKDNSSQEDFYSFPSSPSDDLPTMRSLQRLLPMMMMMMMMIIRKIARINR